MAVKTFTTEVLTSADTNTYLANSGLVYVTSATIGTGVSSVTVSSAFSSTYDNYKIICAGGIASATGTNLGLQMGSTTTGYRNSLIGVEPGPTTSITYDNNTNNRWIWAGGIDTTGVLGNIELFNPFLSIVTFADMNMVRAGAAGHWKAFGTLANTTSYTAFTLYPASGTLTGGTVTVYGYRKA
jgi:hypothetical protein